MTNRRWQPVQHEVHETFQNESQLLSDWPMPKDGSGHREQDCRSPPSALCRSSTVVMPKVRDLRVRVASVLAIVAVSSCLVPVLATAKGYWLVASDGASSPSATPPSTAPPAV